MIRKDLWPKVKAARQSGQRTFLCYDKIVFCGQQESTAANTTVITNALSNQPHEVCAVGDQSDQSQRAKFVIDETVIYQTEYVYLFVL